MDRRELLGLIGAGVPASLLAPLSAAGAFGVDGEGPQELVGKPQVVHHQAAGEQVY